MAVANGDVTAILKLGTAHRGVAIVVDVRHRKFSVLGIVRHLKHLALGAAELAQSRPLAWAGGRLDHLEVLLQEQVVRGNDIARAVLCFNFDTCQNWGVEVGIGRLDQCIVWVNMEVGVFRMDLQLAKMPVKGHHLASPVTPAEKPTLHHAVFDLRKVDEFFVHGCGRHMEVHVSFGRVLEEREQPVHRPQLFGELSDTLGFVFALFLGAVRLFRLSFLPFFLFPFLRQAFRRRQCQRGGGKEKCHPTCSAFHEGQGTRVCGSFNHPNPHFMPLIFFTAS